MKKHNVYLKNKLLIAMPRLQDPYFAKTVTLICDHNAEGAMGVTLNRSFEMQFGEILEQLDIPISNYIDNALNQPVMIGGPVAPDNGLVLHQHETQCKNIWDSTLAISNELFLTTSQDIMYALGTGNGPNKQLFSLGYSGWEAGQLEAEIKENSWLIAPVSLAIIFDLPLEQRWEAAAQSMGIDMTKLSHVAGHA